ncbi:MAG: hypothetical protein IPJ69_08990 [Deltaproteobacteria bacterium]|nr:MAG: hypothetical protein IPJ69_08990 [Deltaproteobacteria bacterium]
MNTDMYSNWFQVTGLSVATSDITQQAFKLPVYAPYIQDNYHDIPSYTATERALALAVRLQELLGTPKLTASNNGFLCQYRLMGSLSSLEIAFEGSGNKWQINSGHTIFVGMTLAVSPDLSTHTKASLDAMMISAKVLYQLLCDHHLIVSDRDQFKLKDPQLKETIQSEAWTRFLTGLGYVAPTIKSVDSYPRDGKWADFYDSMFTLANELYSNRWKDIKPFMDAAAQNPQQLHALFSIMNSEYGGNRDVQVLKNKLIRAGLISFE